MCDLTVVNPTKDPLALGENINQSVLLSIYLGPDLGSGTVTTYTSEAFIMSGTYDAFSQHGSFSVHIAQEAPNLWNVSIDVTGTEHNFTRYFSATCSQSENQIVFQSTSSGDSVTVQQDNGSPVTAGKILLQASWISLTSEIIAN